MGQEEVEAVLEAEGPPGVAYRLFRRGIERHAKLNINK